MEEININDIFKKGVVAHKKGHLREAGNFYRAVLKINPEHSDANHNLGVLAVAVGQANEAISHFEKALNKNPTINQYWLSYVDALIQTGQITKVNNILISMKNQGCGPCRCDTAKGAADSSRACCLAIS